MKELIAVEKEVYEAVLRNSVRVIDLEAENAQLHKFLEEFNALDVAKENQQLKELLKDLADEADGALQAIQKDCESDDWSIFRYPEVQYFYDLKTKIDNAIGEKK